MNFIFFDLNDFIIVTLSPINAEFVLTLNVLEIALVVTSSVFHSGERIYAGKKVSIFIKNSHVLWLLKHIF